MRLKLKGTLSILASKIFSKLLPKEKAGFTEDTAVAAAAEGAKAEMPQSYP